MWHHVLHLVKMHARAMYTSCLLSPLSVLCNGQCCLCSIRAPLDLPVCPAYPLLDSMTAVHSCIRGLSCTNMCLPLQLA